MDQQTAFNTLKTAITSISILAFPDTATPFCIKADSSNYTTGVVFFQKSKTDSKWHPVTSFGKSLSSVEHNYEIYDKEMLVII